MPEVSSSSEYPQPVASYYFDAEVIESIPVEQGVDALMQWFDTNLNPLVEQKNQNWQGTEREAKLISAMLWNYIAIKETDSFAQTDPSSSEPEFNPSYRQGQIDACKSLFVKLGAERLEGEAHVIDELFTRAQSISGASINRPANRTVTVRR